MTYRYRGLPFSIRMACTLMVSQVSSQLLVISLFQRYFNRLPPQKTTTTNKQTNKQTKNNQTNKQTKKKKSLSANQL